MVVCDQKLKAHVEFLCDDTNGGMNGDFKYLTQSIKVFLSEVQARVAKGTVTASFLQTFI